MSICNIYSNFLRSLMRTGDRRPYLVVDQGTKIAPSPLVYCIQAVGAVTYYVIQITFVFGWPVADRGQGTGAECLDPASEDPRRRNQIFLQLLRKVAPKSSLGVHTV